MEVIVSVSPTVQNDSSPDAELPLQSRAIAFRLEPPLDGVTDMCGDILEIRPPLLIPRHSVAVIPDRQVMLPVLAPRVIVIVFAWASMLFSTNSAIAFSGLLCDRAMMRMAFQSSPIFSRPRSKFARPREAFFFAR